MVIEGEDYKLTSIDNSSPHFDLELLHTIKPKGKEPRKEFKIEAYGISLESAMRRIIQYRINNKYDTISLEDYLQEFRKIAKSLTDTFKL